MAECTPNDSSAPGTQAQTPTYARSTSPTLRHLGGQSGSTRSVPAPADTTSKCTAKPSNLVRTHSSRNLSELTVTPKRQPSPSSPGTIAPKPKKTRLLGTDVHPIPLDLDLPETEEAVVPAGISQTSSSASSPEDPSEMSATDSQTSHSSIQQDSSSSSVPSKRPKTHQTSSSSLRSLSSTAQEELAKIAGSAKSAKDVVSAFGCSPSVPEEFGTMATTVTMLRSSQVTPFLFRRDFENMFRLRR